MADLGSFFDPQGAQGPVTGDAQQPTLKDQWDAYLQNPGTRAALLSAGLSMMAGGWGSPMQNIAAGIGQGVEAGANVGSNIQKNVDQNDAIFRQRRKELEDNQLQRENMANRTEIANIYANQRITTAGMRIQPKSGAEAAAYNRTFNATATSLRQSIPYISGELSEDQVLQQAQQAAENAIAGARGIGAGVNGGGVNGGNLATPNGGGTSAGTIPPGNNSGATPSQNAQTQGTNRIRNPQTGQILTRGQDGNWYDEKTGQRYNGQ